MESTGRSNWGLLRDLLGVYVKVLQLESIWGQTRRHLKVPQTSLAQQLPALSGRVGC